MDHPCCLSFTTNPSKLKWPLLTSSLTPTTTKLLLLLSLNSYLVGVSSMKSSLTMLLNFDPAIQYSRLTPTYKKKKLRLNKWCQRHWLRIPEVIMHIILRKKKVCKWFLTRIIAYMKRKPTNQVIKTMTHETLARLPESLLPKKSVDRSYLVPLYSWFTDQSSSSNKRLKKEKGRSILRRCLIL